MSRRLLTLFGQAVVFGLIALVLGYFSTSPAYVAFPKDQARILLDFSHVGQRKGECRRLTPEEIAEMPANMRRAEICPRERLPVAVELELDGTLIFNESLPPSGLSGDGASQIYESIRVRPGEHRLIARLRDSAREDGFDFEAEAAVVLQPAENFVIDFRSELGGFIFGAGRAQSATNGD